MNSSIIKNRVLMFIVNKSILKLVLVGITVYVLTAVIFASLYFAIDGIEKSGESNALDMFDYLYFSFSAQTTSGYGGLSAVNLGKLLIIIQSIIGITAPSVILGTVVSKLLWPSKHGLRTSRLVVFYPDKNYFRFRFFNTQSIPLEEVYFKARFRTPIVPGSIILNQYDVVLDRTFAPLLTYNNVYLVNTTESASNDQSVEDSSDGAQVKVLLSPMHIKKDSTLLLQIKGTFYQSNLISTTDFKFSQIRCGQFVIIQESPPAINHKNVDLHERVLEVTCHKCKLRNDCELEDKWIS